MKSWLNVEFVSSCNTTDQFKSFARNFKSYLKKLTKDNFDIVNFNRGHFDVSGFLKNKENNKLVYFSVSDVRFFPNEWYNHVLVRTAKHDKDYTGGSNNYSTLDEIENKALYLTK